MDTDALPRVRLAAVVVGGGAGSRVGGVSKPEIAVAGVRMVDRVLTALRSAGAGSGQTVLVGPPGLGSAGGPAGTREQPPGGGPVAGIGAGMTALTRLCTPDFVAVVAADMPMLTAESLDDLTRALKDEQGEAESGEQADVAVFTDDTGRAQWLCGVWRAMSLTSRLTSYTASRPDGLAGASMRGLMEPLRVAGVPWAGTGLPPYFDCDTPADIERATAWLNRERDA